MAKLVWDQIGEHFYETGVDRVVLYPFAKATNNYPKGVAWNGVTSIEESPSGAEASPFYADNIKYLNLISAETYGATINAYAYPDEFDACNGYKEMAPGVVIGQQSRDTFGLVYRTLIGNDTEGNDKGYKLKFVWGAQAAPSTQSHSTVNDSPAPGELSWTISTTPVQVAGFKPTASLDIDSTKVDAAALAALENIIYGTSGSVNYSVATGVTYDSYDAVTPTTGDNPKANGWYVAGAGSTYVLTNDETVQDGTTYYAKTAGSNPNTNGWYERSGSEGAYVYTISGDTTAVQGKTYYVRTETGGTDAKLPMPEEIAALFNAEG